MDFNQEYNDLGELTTTVTHPDLGHGVTTLHVWECKACGAVVSGQEVHNQWHAQLALA